jgi:hypothetical protein
VLAHTLKPVLVASVLAGAAAAAAQAQDPRNDPAAGSPAGVVYEIPLDTARRDAAPRLVRGGAGSRGDTPASPIRSENGFGSSSQVPGAADGDGSRADSESDGGSGARGGGGDGGAGTRGDRGRPASGGGGAEVAATGERLIAASGPVTPQPSSTRAYLLLALGVLVAVAIAVTSRRVTR